MSATYRICPRCARAISVSTRERFCPNDGERLLERCPACNTRFHNPFARHCAGCGRAFSNVQGKKEACALAGERP